MVAAAGKTFETADGDSENLRRREGIGLAQPSAINALHGLSGTPVEWCNGAESLDPLFWNFPFGAGGRELRLVSALVLEKVQI